MKGRAQPIEFHLHIPSSCSRRSVASRFPYFIHHNVYETALIKNGIVEKRWGLLLVQEARIFIPMNDEKVSLADVIELFTYYQEITRKTGEQLNFAYEKNAFPYEIKNVDNRYLILSSTLDLYHKIYVGFENDSTLLFRLSQRSTHGDKAKAVEFCKFFAKKLKARLQLFNGRTMYF